MLLANGHKVIILILFFVANSTDNFIFNSFKMSPLKRIFNFVYEDTYQKKLLQLSLAIFYFYYGLPFPVNG
jgi:hypothetical protein